MSCYTTETTSSNLSALCDIKKSSSKKTNTVSTVVAGSILFSDVLNYQCYLMMYNLRSSHIFLWGMCKILIFILIVSQIIYSTSSEVEVKVKPFNLPAKK